MKPLQAAFPANKYWDLNGEREGNEVVLIYTD
jgi:hypothetical protein